MSAIPPQARDRLLGFAFAAADLLVETGEDETITWAAGAFGTRFGASADSFVGRPIDCLIAPADRPALARILAGVAIRGRITPVALRLSDPQETGCALAALVLPGARPRICITLGPLPADPPAGVNGVRDAADFRQETEARLRAGQNGSLGLLDVQGWKNPANSEERKMPRNEIGHTVERLLQESGLNAMVGEMADGRFGVLTKGDLSQGSMNMDRLAAAVEALVRAAPGGAEARVASQVIGLSQQGLTGPQAVRALRFALTRFADGGVPATETQGFGDGLAGFILQAESRAKAIRSAITNRQFRLVYQPVVSIAGRRVHHYEALLRPDVGAATPALSTQEFVTFAEAVGLSEELDLAVLEQTLAALSGTFGLRIAVNISGLSIQSLDFQAKMFALIDAAAAEVRAGRLLMELTETAEIEDVPGAATMLDRLRAAGVPVCIDDFGAGAAAFRYLRDFRMDYVKIDGAYVRAAANGERERGFVTSMHDLARSVGAQVIAEMIETEEEAALMASLGVQYGQGWLFGRPAALPRVNHLR